MFCTLNLAFKTENGRQGISCYEAVAFKCDFYITANMFNQVEKHRSGDTE